MVSSGFGCGEETNSKEASTRPAMLEMKQDRLTWRRNSMSLRRQMTENLTTCFHVFHVSKCVKYLQDSNNCYRCPWLIHPVQTVKKMARMCLAKLLHHTWRYSGDEQPLAIGTG